MKPLFVQTQDAIARSYLSGELDALQQIDQADASALKKETYRCGQGGSVELKDSLGRIIRVHSDNCWLLLE